jgi:hypothetical protein
MTPLRKKQMKALGWIFGVFIVALGLLSAFDAPDWLKSAVTVAYPVSWLIVATIISIRSRRSDRN